MLVSKLESLNETQSFVDRAADGQVVDGDLAQLLFAVDDEEAAEGEALVLLVDAVRFGNGARLVGEQWNVQRSESALLAGRVDPGQVAEVAVRRAGNQFTIDLLELFSTLREGNNFSRADKGAARERERTPEFQ